MKILPLRMELGEGPIWHDMRESWIWLDILDNKLYEATLGDLTEQNYRAYPLPSMATALAVDSSESIAMVTESGFISFNLETFESKLLCDLPIAESMRSNDGGVGADGKFWFGTMQRTPSDSKGALYSISSQLDVKKHLEGLTIPNTLVWINDESLYVSDSCHHKLFKIELDENNNLPVSLSGKAFFDFSDQSACPDGGALDENGNLWIALWGAHKVACISPQGNIIDQIMLPIPQPSSCCFGGPENRHLFVTSAREGMGREEIDAFPLSGSVFVKELEVKGAVIPHFKLEN